MWFVSWYYVIAFVVLFSAAADDRAVALRRPQLKTSENSAIVEGDFAESCLEL